MYFYSRSKFWIWIAWSLSYDYTHSYTHTHSADFTNKEKALKRRLNLKNPDLLELLVKNVSQFVSYLYKVKYKKKTVQREEKYQPPNNCLFGREPLYTVSLSCWISWQKFGNDNAN